MSTTNPSLGGRRPSNIATPLSESCGVSESETFARCSCGRRGRFGCGVTRVCAKSAVNSRRKDKNSPVRKIGLDLPGKEPDNVPLGSDKFHSACRKAYRARALHLKRHLTLQECARLRTAVRKQCSSHRRVQFESVMSGIERRVKNLEKVAPVSIQSLQDAIHNTYDQLGVLRRQLLDAIEQQDTVSETCSHMKHKTVVPITTPFSIIHNTNPLGLIHSTFKEGLARLCCSSCVEKREDLVFYWFGYQFPSFGSMVYTGNAPSPLKDVSPLAVPTVWTQILDIKYQRAEGLTDLSSARSIRETDRRL